jgi:hypothetical protein
MVDGGKMEPRYLGCYGILEVPRKICFRFPGAAAKNRKKCLISPRIGNK